jgi:hypothetical protein
MGAAVEITSRWRTASPSRIATEAAHAASKATVVTRKQSKNWDLVALWDAERRREKRRRPRYVTFCKGGANAKNSIGDVHHWGMAACAQAQNDTSGGTDKAAKVDRAAAYYHYALACLYAQMDGASGGRNPEYADKAIESYEAAVRADPQTPGHMPPRFVVPALPVQVPGREPTPDSK